jgi:hypothetical protein
LGDASGDEQSAQWAAADAALFGELLEAHAGKVARDEIVRVRKFQWSDHVYDFTTATGFIVAGGVIVSNCRCRVVGASGPETARLAGGKPGYTEPPAGWDEIDPKTGEQVGIDKGWGYMPGATSDLVREIERKAEKLPQPLNDAVKEDIASVVKTRLRKEFDEVIERASAEAQIEYASLLNGVGERLWIKRGRASGVDFSLEEFKQMKGGMLIHNHPRGLSLSLDDLKIAGLAEVRRIYAVANDQSAIYAATVKQDKVAELIEKYWKYENAVRQKLIAVISRGRVQASEAERWYHHIINSLMAKDGLISYRIIGKVPQWVKEVISELHPG